MSGLTVTLNVLLLAVAGVALARQVARTSDAVRVRNALLLRRGRADDFDWTPARLPADFRVETAAPAPWLVAALERMGTAGRAGAWEKAVCIAGHLSEHAQDKGRIRADLQTTYERIREGHGYCADHARVFLAFAHGAGVFARQWAFSFDGFGGHGHVFVEVYDAQRRQWIFLDVYNNFHALDPVTLRPLSALELRAALAGNAAFPKIERNGPGRRGFPREEKLVDYYTRGMQEWYLWWGNAALPDDERRRPGLWGTRLRTARHALLALLGRSPRIRVLETAQNRVQVRRLGELRRRVLASVLLCALLGTTLAWQLSGIRMPGTASPGDGTPLATQATHAGTALEER